MATDKTDSKKRDTKKGQSSKTTTKKASSAKSPSKAISPMTNRGPNPFAGKPGSPSKPAAQASSKKQQASKSHEETLDKMEAQLNAWRKELKKMVDRGDVGAQKAIRGSRDQFEQLSAKIEKAQKKIDAARARGATKWDRLKDDAEGIWDEVEAAFARLTQKGGRA